MILWNPSSETMTPLRRVGGGGVSLALWAGPRGRVLAATPTTVFRVWDSEDRWSTERWNVAEGRVQVRWQLKIYNLQAFKVTEGK